MNIKIDLQIAIKNEFIPKKNDFKKWLDATVNETTSPQKSTEICIRIIDTKESANLNKTYRHKSGPTNILSFDYEHEPKEETHLLGDLAICAPIVNKEAAEQKKPALAHWAHITIHGYLHLAGYQHQTKKQTEKMENLEIKILQNLGYNPYEN
jgi:probable rRNA maturation factor